jgi:hypothetical protein
MRTEDEVQHLCRLASIAVSMVYDPGFAEEFAAGDSSEQHNMTNCLQILADAYVELAARQGIKPRFKVQARA